MIFILGLQVSINIFCFPCSLTIVFLQNGNKVCRGTCLKATIRVPTARTFLCRQYLLMYGICVTFKEQRVEFLTCVFVALSMTRSPHVPTSAMARPRPCWCYDLSHTEVTLEEQNLFFIVNHYLWCFVKIMI